MRSLDRLNAWIARARDLGVVAIDTETTSLDPMQATLCGIALAVGAERGLLRAARAPEGRRRAAAAVRRRACARSDRRASALAALKPLLEDPGVLKIGHNLKFDWQIFALRGIDLRLTTTPC